MGTRCRGMGRNCANGQHSRGGATGSKLGEILGTRSIGGAFAPLAFGTTDWPDYASIANDEILVVLQIESLSGLQNLDAILGVPGVDVAFVGPNDLHASLGLPPSNEGAEPEFVKAIEQIKAGARQHNVALGIFTSGGEAAGQRIREGFQMVSVTSDLSSLLSGATQQLHAVKL